MARPRKQARLCKLRNSKYWYIRDYETDPDGTERRVLFSTGKTDELGAKQCLTDWLNHKNAPRSSATVSELLEKRMQDMRGRKLARAKNTVYYHNQLRAHFGHMRPDQIMRSHVHAYWEKREDCHGSLREELLELRMTLRFAQECGWIASVPKFDIPAPLPSRDRIIRREEAERLLAAASSMHLRLFILIAMTTGARKSAITGLTWDRVDFHNRRIDFRDPHKTITRKRRAEVPADPTTMALLEEARKYAQTDYVIEYMGKPVKDIKKSFQKAAQKAGLPDVSPHVLKHSVISWLAMDGHTVDQISDMTATTRETVTRVYRHVKPEYLEGLAGSLAPSANIAQIFSKPSQ